MPIPWNEDEPRDAAVLVRNLAQALRRITQDALRRWQPTVAMAQEWHRQIYRGVRLPVPYYAGEIRDSDPEFPELYGYEVRIGPHLGVASRLVPQQLTDLEAVLQQAVAVLDSTIPAGGRPSNAGQLHSVLTLCANAHGDWIRIHPFANGNGRIARLWANWCALRYGLPSFVRLKPRPEGSLYAGAAASSMRGDHMAMVAVFADMLDRHLSAPGPN